MSQAMSPEEFRRHFLAIEEATHKVIVGMGPVVRSALTALVAGGNILVEGVPGLGKTLLVKTLSEALDLRFARIQFTPDLMPADITGTRMVLEGDDGRKSFSLHKGPIFNQIILADEVNRATPKTQSALLEAMQEAQVTIVGETYPLEAPFFVVATQNPLEMDGTYPLPEAQLDRFFFKLQVEFPSLQEMRSILFRTTRNEEQGTHSVCDGETLLAMGQLAREVLVKESVQDYAIRVMLATHPTKSEAPELVRKYVRYGASPRGAQAMLLAAKVRALLEGRENASVDDLRAVAVPALRHRLILNFEGEAEGLDPDRVIAAVLDSVRA